MLCRYIVISSCLCHIFFTKKRPVVRTTGLCISFCSLPLGTWLSSHDCANLELRHHQKFAVNVIVFSVFVSFRLQSYAFSFYLQSFSWFFLPNDKKKFIVSAHNVKIVIFLRKNLLLVNKSTIFALDKIIYLQLQIPLINIFVDGSVLRHPLFLCQLDESVDDDNLLLETHVVEGGLNLLVG